MRIAREIPVAELIANVREVPLLNDRTVFPYADAEIRIEAVDTDEIAPTTLYVVKGGLEFQTGLSQNLHAQGHYPLRLTGGLQLVDGDKSTGLIPPVVEDDPEFGPCLLDGAHRVYNQRKMFGRSIINVLRITGTIPDAPIYALPNNWTEVVEYDETPSDPKLKKHYRDNPKSLYRDFSKLNGGQMRESTS